MIVPRNRIIHWSLALLPSTLVVAFSPGLAVYPAGFYGVLCLLSLLDLILSRSSESAIGLETPRIIRLVKNKEAGIELRVVNESGERQSVRLGLMLPREFDCSFETRNIQLPQAHKAFHLTWPCTAKRRGVYRLERCFVERPSRLGFWAFQSAVSLDSEMRVYPNLSRERRTLASIFLNRGLAGIHHQRMMGKGREFEKLREYIPGDSYDDIHWKATARRNVPVTKVYQVERTQEIYVVVDSSRLSGQILGEENGGIPETALERFVSAATTLALVSERQGDLFGLITASDKVRTFLRAGSGKSHMQCCQEALLALHPEEVNPDFDEVFSYIRLHLRRRALIVFLTDLRDPVLAENFSNRVSLIARQHLVYVDSILSPKVGPLFDGNATDSTEHIYEKLAGHFQWQSLIELRKILQREGVRLELVGSQELSVSLLNQYLSMKQRQAL